MKKLSIISILLALTTLYASSHANPTFTDIAWGMSERQGKRATMEDSFVKGKLQLSPYGDKDYYFGVFDGHGGDDSAKFAAKNAVSSFFWSFNALLEKQKEMPFNKQLSVDQMIAQAFQDSYMTLDGHMQKNFIDGTTAISALISGDTAYLAWAGDARGIIFDANGTIQAATTDHKPDAAAELARIGDTSKVYYLHGVEEDSTKKMQRIAIPYGTKRPELRPGFTLVKGVARIGGLAISRTLGDNPVKKQEPAVIAEPEILSMPINAGDSIILACDGLWDVMSNEEVVDFVNEHLAMSIEQIKQRYPDMQPQNEVFAREEGSAEKSILIARALRDKAYEEESQDNITILFIQLAQKESDQRPFSLAGAASATNQPC